MKKKTASRTRKKPRISILPEYSDLVPKLSDAEYGALKQSIKDDGQQMPIIVNEHGVILDGHHRYKACKELGLQPKTAKMKFKTKDEERLFVINTNLNRRQLNLYQRTVLALKKKPMLAKLAKENMRQAKVSRIRETLHVDDRLAKDAGVSKEVLYRVEKIEREGSEELNELARTGRFSINRAYSLIGRHPSTVLLFDNVQKAFDKISESLSKILPGSEQERAALQYIENLDHAINSISDEDSENGNAFKILIRALFGNEDCLIATRFFATMGKSIPPELVRPALDLDEGEKVIFQSAAAKLIRYPPYLITFSTQERNLLLKIMESVVSNAKRHLGSSV